jgi:DNA primase
MPRIPEEEIERIKTETNLVALIQSRGVALNQQGLNWTGLCPFHDDKQTPNLIVTPGKGLFRCMAANCGKTGNAIQFVQWHDGVSFRHAFELLANGGKVAFEQSAGIAKKSLIQKLPCPLDAEEDSKALAQVSDYYAERLAKNPDALAYLASRGLDDESLIERFKIGFSDRTLGLRIPHARRKDGAELREKLKTLGVYRKKTSREHLLGCITVPLANQKGEAVQIYGRRIDPKAPKENRHLYLARPLAGIFNPTALTDREIILTESIIDALTFIRDGMENTTCIFGTENFTEELFDAIRAAKIESVKLAFDADEAGDKATAKIAAKLQAIGIECYQIKFPWKSDANQYALDQGGEALKNAVRNAAWLELKARETPKAEAADECGEIPSRAPSSLVANLAAREAELPVLVAKEGKAPIQPTTPELSQVGDSHEITFGQRLYRIGGLHKNSSPEVLKITLRITCEGLMHVDSLDLYRDGERRKFIDRAAEETTLEKDLLKRDLGKLLLLLEQAQEERLNTTSETTPAHTMTDTERSEALGLLKSPDIIDMIARAYDKAGVVGERNNLIAAYLAATSRKLDKPLAIIIQSTSAAGKSTLMDAILSFFPKEEQVKYSAMTGQSLYYLGESNLKHKILAIVEEEGAEKASYALKLLQSEGELTIASTGKDPHSGRMETQEYHVQGPVMIILTTTSIDIDEELMNRCLVLTVDESREQTERIHTLQRKARTLEGLRMKKERGAIQTLLQNAQRLLKPVAVVNPYSDELTFTSGRTRTRRDHEKYLTLIESVTLLHQHQRPLEEDAIAGPHIKTTLEDIEAANRIAPEVLGRSLDELPPQTRRLLESIKQLVRNKMKSEKLEQRISLFSRRELRDFTGWSETQTRLHLERLEAMEYVSRRSGKQGSLCKYELLTAANEPQGSWHVGLLDVAKLKKKKSA